MLALLSHADPMKKKWHCCRGDDSDSESSSGSDQRKPIPDWARGRALMQQLASQVQQDPDEVFQQHRKTCSLDEVFGASGGHAQTTACDIYLTQKSIALVLSHLGLSDSSVPERAEPQDSFV